MDAFRFGKTVFAAGIHKDTPGYERTQKKKGWLHLPAVSRGLADSQHSLCATTPSPEGTWRVLSHLSVRATRAHPILKEFIAGSHIHLKTCICGPLRAAVWGPYNLDNSVWSRTLYTAYQHLI